MIKTLSRRRTLLFHNVRGKRMVFSFSNFRINFLISTIDWGPDRVVVREDQNLPIDANSAACKSNPLPVPFGKCPILFVLLLGKATVCQMTVLTLSFVYLNRHRALKPRFPLRTLSKYSGLCSGRIFQCFWTFFLSSWTSMNFYKWPWPSSGEWLVGRIFILAGINRSILAQKTNQFPFF